MTQIQQGIIDVIATGLVTIIYWLVSWQRHGDCEVKQLVWIAVNALSGVTGIFIIVGCFEIMKVAALNGVWSGIAGILLTLATTTEIIKQFKGLWARRIMPTKED